MKRRLSVMHALTVKIGVPLLSLSLVYMVAGCATFGGGSGDGDSDRGRRNRRAPSGKSAGRGGGGGGGGGSAYVSAKRATLINSMSNNGMTSKTISFQKAAQQAGRLSGAKDKRTLEGRLSALRLARKDMRPILETAKRIAELEMKRNASAEIGPEVKLGVALAAINNRKFALANYYLAELMSSKRVPAKIRAGAYNANGVIAMRDGRIPEAVSFFKQALKASSNYRPAKLNLGFAALKGGDLGTAKRALAGMQEDWFVKSAMISVARLEGNGGRVGQLCSQVLRSHPKHKPTLFNCALHEFQAKNNFKKAKSLLKRMTNAPGGEKSWNRKAYDVLGKIRFAQTKFENEQAKKKAPQGGGKKKNGKGGKGKG